MKADCVTASPRRRAADLGEFVILFGDGAKVLANINVCLPERTGRTSGVKPLACKGRRPSSRPRGDGLMSTATYAKAHLYACEASHTGQHGAANRMIVPDGLDLAPACTACRQPMTPDDRRLSAGAGASTIAAPPPDRAASRPAHRATRPPAPGDRYSAGRHLHHVPAAWLPGRPQRHVPGLRRRPALELPGLRRRGARRQRVRRGPGTVPRPPVRSRLCSRVTPAAAPAGARAV